eukprot:scaffold2033_cov164-Amphora_coffeaeformis.AAC.26
MPDDDTKTSRRQNHSAAAVVETKNNNASRHLRLLKKQPVTFLFYYHHSAIHFVSSPSPTSMSPRKTTTTNKRKKPTSTAATKRKLDFVPDDDKRPKASGAAAPKSTTTATTTTPTSIQSFASPVSKRHKRSVVTPEDEAKKGRDKQQEEQELFVPKYIHKNLSYARRGKSELDPIKQKAFAQILDSHVIPTDLEQSRAYGPLSGTCYEERVLRAYTLGKLTVKDGYDGETRICTACANQGHTRNECPTLI